MYGGWGRYVVPCLILISGFKTQSHATAAKSHNWKLVWHDEFDYTGQLNPKKWIIETDTDGWGNNELQHYSSELDNLRVEDGHLVIEARRENNPHYKYSSGRVYTKGPGWLYGRFEVRAKVPTGVGLWPAIWMMAVKQTYGEGLWPDNGEIDLMEYVGRDPGKILGCFYTKDFIWMNNNGIDSTINLDGLEKDYHVYALEWDAEQMSLFVDDQLFNVFKNPHTNWREWPFDRPFHIILNLAMGSYGGDIEDENIFPRQFLIDYVRVYQ